VGVCCGGAAPRSGSTGERQRLPGAGRWGELAVRGLSRGDCDRAVWTLPSAWDFFLPQREGRARGGPGRVWAARLTGSGAARPPAPSRGSDGQQMPDRRASPQIPGWCVVNRWRPSAGRRCRPGAGPVWWRCRAGVPAGAGALKRPSGPRGGPPAARAATGRIREWRPIGGLRGGSSPRGRLRAHAKAPWKGAEDRATPGGYGGKPPGVAIIGVPTGARNAGRCSDGGPEHRFECYYDSPHDASNPEHIRGRVRFLCGAAERDRNAR
jgi:hypothetical protein